MFSFNIYTIDGIQLTVHDVVLESAFQILCLNNTYVTRDMLFLSNVILAMGFLS